MFGLNISRSGTTPYASTRPIHGVFGNELCSRGGLRDGVDLLEVHNVIFVPNTPHARDERLAGALPKGFSWDGRLPFMALFTLVLRIGAASVGLRVSTNGWFDAAWRPTGRPAKMPTVIGMADLGKDLLSLHGRIANQPAYYVEVRVALDPPYELSVTGQVEEGGLFYPHLVLTTTYTTVPGSNRIVIHDPIDNRVEADGDAAPLSLQHRPTFPLRRQSSCRTDPRSFPHQRASRRGESIRWNRMWHRHLAFPSRFTVMTCWATPRADPWRCSSITPRTKGWTSLQSPGSALLHGVEEHGCRGGRICHGFRASHQLPELQKLLTGAEFRC